MNPTICMVQPSRCSVCETYIQALSHRLPAQVRVIAGIPDLDGRPLMPTGVLGRAWCKFLRTIQGRTWHADLTRAYVKVFRRYRPSAVLAHYGPTGVIVMDACHQAGLPLIVHFHGYDASETRVLEEEKEGYARLFQQASAIIAVSKAMRRKLIELGAPPGKVHWNPVGIDCTTFDGAKPEEVPPSFVAVGKFSAKKAPHLTIGAFAEVHRQCPDARLRMIGLGPLKESSVHLVEKLGIASAVTIMGPCPPDVIADELRTARCFVQHSVIAPNGDSEGTPATIVEAGASGLPVVSTRHAGIPDVVIEGETGFLVEEGDVEGMAERMLRFAFDPALAGEMGRNARRWVEAEFSITKRIGNLWDIIQSCVAESVGVTTP
jgi:glycosyltransferase involved in cell wall biosynthesis